MNKCKTCGNNCEKEYCFKHKPRKPIKMRKIEEKPWILYTDIEGEAEINRVVKQQFFFLSIWSKRGNKSEISGTYLGKEPLTIYFHHILPKENYPQAEFDEENIILLTWEEHDQVEMDESRYPEINKRRQQLKIKYNL